jgi:hypothetical protein
MATIQGSFSLNGIPRNAITAKLWSANAFTGSPAYGTALPSGSPLQSTTTARTSGFDGAYRFTGVEPGEYYVSLTFGGNNTYQHHSIQTEFDFQITDFGAVGDGTTNDRAAFIAADAQGGTILVPATSGGYYISGSIELTKAYFVGDGWGTAGASNKTKLKFSHINAASGAIYTRQATTLVKTVGLENIYCEAMSWDATSGALGYGFDIEQRVTLRNVMSYGFKKSGYFFHNDAAGSGPYHSIIDGCSAERNGQHGFLVGTGANVLTFINPQARTNGATAYNTAPVSAGSYDGFHIERDNDGNPGTIYLAKAIEGIKILGGDCSTNSRYGWNFVQCSSCDLSPGYAENNYTSGANLGAGVTYCFIRFGKLASDEASVALNVAGATQYKTNQVYVGGLFLGGGNTDRYDYSHANKRTYLLDVSSDVAYIDVTTGDVTVNLNPQGNSILKIGTNTHFLTVSGNVVNLPATFYHQGLQWRQGTAAPVAGTFEAETITRNTAITSGEPFAWICVTAGTPGIHLPIGFTTNGRIITATTATLTVNDDVVFSNPSSAAARTLTLPATGIRGKLLTIKDNKGDANVNNITVSGTIDGGANYTINAAYGFATFVWNDTEWSRIN